MINHKEKNKTFKNKTVEVEYLRAKGISEKFSISLTQVWRLTKSGKFNAYKVSAQTTLFNVDEVRKALFDEVA